MANDPYGASADFNEHYVDSGPPRTSVLAILSLVCSLICFIPGLSAIGSLLGVFALLGISASKGRVKGTGLAIAGIAVGIVVSLLWFGAAIAAQKASSQYVAFGQVITDIDSGSYDAARGQLSTPTRDLATDERLAAFKAEYEAEAGQLDSWPTGFIQVFGLFMEVGKRGQQPDNTTLPYADPMPLPAKFGNGARLVWFILDRGQMDDAGRKPAIINAAILGADGNLIWLVDPDIQRAAMSGNATPPPASDDADDAAPEETPAEEAGDGSSEEAPEDSGG